MDSLLQKKKACQAIDENGIILYINSMTPYPLGLTEKAAARIRFLSEKQGNAGLFLRLTVESGGCSGLQYKFNLDDKIDREGDIAVQRGAARLVTDKVSMDFLKGTEVDFISDISGEMFIVQNPNADSSCGCGTSFSVKM